MYTQKYTQYFHIKCLVMFPLRPSIANTWFTFFYVLRFPDNSFHNNHPCHHFLFWLLRTDFQELFNGEVSSKLYFPSIFNVQVPFSDVFIDEMVPPPPCFPFYVSPYIQSQSVGLVLEVVLVQQ